MNRKNFIKKAYKQLTRTGIIWLDWGTLGVKIIGHDKGFQIVTSKQFKINTAEYTREYKGIYKTLPAAQAAATREVIENSRMAKYCI